MRVRGDSLDVGIDVEDAGGRVSGPPARLMSVARSADTSCTTEPMALAHIAYASRAKRDFSTAELAELLTLARARNAALGISGFLLYRDRSFLQVIEGPSQAVDELFEKVSADPRHDRVLVLARGPIEMRGFGRWNMAFVDADSAARRIPGFSELFSRGASIFDVVSDPTGHKGSS